MTHDTTADAVDFEDVLTQAVLDWEEYEKAEQGFGPLDIGWTSGGQGDFLAWWVKEFAAKRVEAAVAAMPPPPVAVTEVMVEAGAKALVGLKYRTSQDIARACLTAALWVQEAPPESDEPLATDAMIVERLSALEAQVHRLRTFAEEMAWYAPEQDWEDAARRLLRFGDVRSIPEIYEAAKGGEG